MKYYLHDTSAFDDEKISELFINFGYEGLGIFYTALEKMAKQEKPIKTSVLKSQLKIGKRLEKCWSFMEEIELISSSNGESFNKQLLNFSESYQIKKEKTREKVSEWRKRQEDIKSVTSYVPVSNHPKVKESKVNISKEENIKRNIFIAPTISEIKDYCFERKNKVIPELFFSHYESNGWMVGKTKMKSWKGAVRTWELNGINNNSKQPEKKEEPKLDPRFKIHGL